MTTLTSYYDIPLVLISILVAIFASYIALSLAGRVTQSTGRTVYRWIGGGALAMGIGIWSMHFIGMLAFRLPIPVGYDISITILSLLLPIAASGFALRQISQPVLPVKHLAGSAIVMGVGINAMHYTGMAAMRMQPAITYDPVLFLASVAIAIAASAASLWIAFRLRGNAPNIWLPRAGAAVVMGIAIVGMHYTGMAAARFPVGSVCMAASRGVSQDGLAIMVMIAAVGILSIALLTSIYDAKLDLRSHRLRVSQALAEERQMLLQGERKARSEAERVSEMKDEFLATLSHELRTPLNAILGWTQILRRGSADEAMLRKGLETIERNARVQAQLIEDLLDMGRIISGKVRLDTEMIDCCGFIEAAIETVRPAALAKHIAIDQELSPEPGFMLGDPNRLQQVMWNLLSNAVKFTPANGRIHVRLEKTGNEAVITVSDSGIGIAPGFLPHVFDRFRQADASTTRRHGGLGLGLSIAKQLVELHGGTIGVNSHGQDQGSTFTVRLPLDHTPALPPAKNAGVASANPHGGVPQPVSLAGIAVLIVDDEADALELAEHIFSSSGAITRTASSAREALRIVGQSRIDVIVSDIGMPEIDGFELIRRIRQQEAPSGKITPAIALTALTRTDDTARALQAGFTGYLSKPAEPPELLAMVASMVHQPAAADHVR